MLKQFVNIRIVGLGTYNQYNRCFSQTAICQSKKKTPFKVLDGSIDTLKSCDENVKYNQSLAQKLGEAMAVAAGGGGEKGIKRHTKQGKCLASQRVKMLLDEDSDFLELSPLAGINMEYGTIPRAGSIGGIGMIHGRRCVIQANDASVKGGTIYPIGLTKQLRLQQIAEENRLPLIFIIDSGGAFLPLQADIFPDKNHGGRTFYKEAIFSSKNIQQLSIVCGSCTAGGAYIPAMSQESVIVKRIGHVFLGGPPLVKAALGEEVSADELGGAMLHCSVSGVTDHYADNEEEAFEIGRDVVASFNVPESRTASGYDEPLYSADDLAKIIPKENQHEMDMYKVLSRLTDGSRFQEFRALWATTLVTGFAHIHGHLVGIIGNNGRLTGEAGCKGAHFIRVCEERRIPLIFLQNVHSVTTSSADEHEDGETTKGIAKMIAAVSCCSVPKLTVVIGDSVGPGNYAMCGRAFDPRFLFLWPNARVAITDPDNLQSHLTEAVLPEGANRNSEESQQLITKVTEKVRFETSSMFSSSRVLDDGIILPQHTRKVLGQCLDVISPTVTHTAASSSVIRM